MDFETPESPDVGKDRQKMLYETITQEITAARTLDDLADAQRKSLALNDANRSRVALDLRERFDELLIETTQRLIAEKGHYEVAS